MNKIKQLNLAEIQKIAAGEVIERPANIVKELIENALDAHADQITLSISQGGKQFIQLIDNGIGMSQEDARLCIQHHATSKINTVEDLENITTFGFRGEALSSIAAISTVHIITKQKHDTIGIQLTIEQGTITKQAHVAANTGTSITIEHIFANVPARRKFLRTTQTEYRTINQLFYAYCLAHPTISFKFLSEHKPIYTCPKIDSLAIRLEQLADTSLTEHLIYIPEQNTISDKKTNTIDITGALTNPRYTRFDRSQLYFFVNSRWVKNYKLGQAFLRGYRGILPTGKYPAGFLFISMPSSQLDVNIHPRKEEVQFLHPGIIEKHITTTIYTALEEYHAQKMPLTVPSAQVSTPHNSWYATPQLNNAPQEASQKNSQEARDNFIAAIENSFTTEKKDITAATQQLQNIPQKITEQYKIEQKIIAKSHDQQTSYQQSVPKNQILSTATQQNHVSYTVLGQLHATYIILQTNEGMVLIDQHAAHERILYEQLRHNFQQPQIVPTLFTEPIKLSSSDCDILITHKVLLQNLGLDIEQLSPTSMRVLSVPLMIKKQSLTEVLQQLVHSLESIEKDNTQNNISGTQELLELLSLKMHADMSCKAAIKAGDRLTNESMHQIVQELYNTKNKLTCPHGRPTIWPLHLTDIEKKFKRNYK